LTVSAGTFNNDAAGGNWEFDGNLNLTGGTLKATSDTMKFPGRDWTVNGGTFTAHSSGTVNFSRGQPQNILTGDVAFTNLTLATSTVLRTSQNITISGETKAGQTAVVDPLACKIISRSKIPTYVLDGKDLKSFENAINGNKFKGSIIG